MEARPALARREGRREGDSAADALDEAAADGEPEAGALPDLLRRDERLEQTVANRGGHAGTGVLDNNLDELRGRSATA